MTLPFENGRITARELARHFVGPAFAASPPPLAPLTNQSPITVIVPTLFRREPELRSCLDSLAAQTHPNYEVLLVDNRGEDAPPPDWLIDYPFVRLLRERGLGNAAARNRGLREVATEIVALTDDDVVVDPGWLTAFARRFDSHPDEAGVGGLMLPKELETEAQVRLEDYYSLDGVRVMEPLSHRLERPRGRWPFSKPTMVTRNDAGEVIASFSLYAPGRLGPGQSRAYRTEALREIGGFDPGLGTINGEDLLVWLRLAWRGYSIGFEPAALVFHVHRRDIEGLRRVVEGYAAGLTATATALVMEDPRHLAAMLATAPQALRGFVPPLWGRLRSAHSESAQGDGRTADAELARLELRGMLRGPAAYVRSARRARRERS